MHIDPRRDSSCRARQREANGCVISLADGGMIMMVRVSVGQAGIYESISNSSVFIFFFSNIYIYV